MVRVQVRANDGTIEFVSAATRDRFVEQGAKCLCWNYLPAIVRGAAEQAGERAGDAAYATTDVEELEGLKGVIADAAAHTAL